MRSFTRAAAVLIALSGAVVAPSAAHATALCDQPVPPPACDYYEPDPDPRPVDLLPRGALDSVTFVGNGARLTGWAGETDSVPPALNPRVTSTDGLRLVSLGHRKHFRAGIVRPASLSFPSGLPNRCVTDWPRVVPSKAPGVFTNGSAVRLSLYYCLGPPGSPLSHRW